jgi:hypothetical protein
MRYSGPQLLSSGCTAQAPGQPSCQLPRKLGPLGPLSYPLGAGSRRVPDNGGFGHAQRGSVGTGEVGSVRAIFGETRPSSIA